MTIESISQVATALSLIFIAISAIASWTQIHKQKKLSVANTHLKLREMFCETNRLIVHSNLRSGGLWAKENNNPTTQEDWIIVEDYLGLFELCEKLLEDKTLDENLFFISYAYRIENILKHKYIMEQKIYNNNENWKLFKDLIKRLDNYKKNRS